MCIRWAAAATAPYTYHLSGDLRENRKVHNVCTTPSVQWYTRQMLSNHKLSFFVFLSGPCMVSDHNSYPHTRMQPSVCPSETCVYGTCNGGQKNSSEEASCEMVCDTRNGTKKKFRYLSSSENLCDPAYTYAEIHVSVRACESIELACGPI
jgi:hypothetical protein